MIKNKKIVCIVLVLCMAFVLFFTGCASKDEGTSQTTTGAAVTSTAATTQAEKDLEEIEITVGQWAFNVYVDNPEGVANDPILKFLEDKFKMKFKWTSLTPDDYNQVVSLWLATDSCPDLWEASTWPVIQDNWDEWSEILLDWSEYVFKDPSRYPILYDIFNDPNYKFANSISNFDKDNYHAWLFASPARLAVMTGVPAYRMDYMENLNRDFPKTMDEFIDLLRAFVNEDPDKNGKKDTYGIALPMYGGNRVELELDPLFFRTHGSYMNKLHEDENGNWYDAAVSPKNKEIWKMLQDLYAEGIFDKEYITRQNVGIDIEGFVAGKCGAISERFPGGETGGQYSGYLDKFLKGNPGSTWKDVQLQPTPLVGPNGDSPSFDVIDFSVGRKMMISGNTKAPERILDLIEYIFCSHEGMMLRSFGVKGVHYTGDDKDNVVLNKEQFKKDITDVYWPNSPQRHQWAPFFRGANNNQCAVWYDEYDNDWLKANQNGKWPPDYTREWDDFLVYIRGIHDVYLEAETINLIPAYNWAAQGLISADVKDQYDSVKARQKDLELEYFNAFLSGKYNVDEKWDEFVSKYEAADPDNIVIKTWTNAVNKAKASTE